MELDKNVVNSVREKEIVMEMLAGGTIYRSGFLTAATGMLLAAPGRGFFKLAIGQDLTTEEMMDENGDTIIRVSEVMIPVIMDSNAICTMTGI